MFTTVLAIIELTMTELSILARKTAIALYNALWYYNGLRHRLVWVSTLSFIFYLEKKKTCASKFQYKLVRISDFSLLVLHNITSRQIS